LARPAAPACEGAGSAVGRDGAWPGDMTADGALERTGRPVWLSADCRPPSGIDHRCCTRGSNAGKTGDVASAFGGASAIMMRRRERDALAGPMVQRGGDGGHRAAAPTPTPAENCLSRRSVEWRSGTPVLFPGQTACSAIRQAGSFTGSQMGRPHQAQRFGITHHRRLGALHDKPGL
jgi:hypothetical protein